MAKSYSIHIRPKLQEVLKKIKEITQALHRKAANHIKASFTQPFEIADLVRCKATTSAARETVQAKPADRDAIERAHLKAARSAHLAHLPVSPLMDRYGNLRLRTVAR